jgi:hypothetical protein
MEIEGDNGWAYQSIIINVIIAGDQLVDSFVICYETLVEIQEYDARNDLTTTRHIGWLVLSQPMFFDR